MTDQVQEQSKQAEAPTMDDYADGYKARQSGSNVEDTPVAEKKEGSDSSNTESNSDKKNDSGEKKDLTDAANTEPKKVDKPNRQNKRAERKIGKLSSKVKEANERIARRDARIAELEAQAPKGEDEKPVYENFDTMDEFQDARDDWRDKRKATDKTPDKGKPAKEATSSDIIAKKEGVTSDEVDDVRDNFSDIVAEGGEDLAKIVEDMPINLKLAREIGDSEVGVELLQYLTSNQEDLDRLLDITSERKLAREIVKLESTVVGNKPKAKTIKVSKASEPMPETGSSSGGSATSEMSMKQYGDRYYKKLGSG